MRIGIYGVVLLALLSPQLASAARKPAEPASGSDCIQNVVVSGGFSTGKTYVATQDHEGVSYPVAFRKTVAALEADGDLVMITPNERTGYIAAENPVRGGGGSTVPVRVTVRRQDGDVIRVEVRITTKGGQMSPLKAMSEALCKVADAASL